MNNSKKMRKSTGVIFSALFAALISVGCFIQIPLPSGVPIVLQDMMAMLSGLLLGPVYGTISVLVFLILGCIGLPVFTGKAGVQVLYASPTCGFLIGYLVSALIGGLFLKFVLSSKKENSNVKSYLMITIASILATVVLFILGIIGFMNVTDSSLSKTLAAVLIPFLPGNIIKIVVMIPLVKKLRPVINNYINI